MKEFLLNLPTSDSHGDIFLFSISFAFTFLFFAWLFQVLRRSFSTTHANTISLSAVLRIIVQGSGVPLALVAAFGVAGALTELSTSMQILIHRLIVLLILIQGGLWGGGFLSLVLASYISAAEDSARRSAFHLIRFLGGGLIWLTVLILSLENVGFDVTTLVAGLGIGGIALALAVQNVLGDILASLSLVIDKPFVVGDSIASGDPKNNIQGTVEEIGVKTCKIRSLSGELIIVPNSELLKGVLRNYKRMNERRVVYSIAVTYETPLQKLRAIPSWLKEIIDAQPLARYDRAHFKAHTDLGLFYEVVYFVQSPDYLVYMDTQQQINFAVTERFEQENVRFAHAGLSLIARRAAPDQAKVA